MKPSFGRICVCFFTKHPMGRTNTINTGIKFIQSCNFPGVFLVKWARRILVLDAGFASYVTCLTQSEQRVARSMCSGRTVETRVSLNILQRWWINLWFSSAEAWNKTLRPCFFKGDWTGECLKETHAGMPVFFSWFYVGAGCFNAILYCIYVKYIVYIYILHAVCIQYY